MRELNFSLDPASLLDVETAVKYLSDLVKPDSFDARHYVAGAKGVDTLAVGSLQWWRTLFC